MKPVFTVFALFSALYLGLMLSELPQLVLVILKVVPVSILLLFSLLRQGAPRYLPIALLFSGCGDALLSLPLEHSFVLGLGAFLVAQLTYASGFVRQRNFSSKGSGVRLGAVIVYLIIVSAFLLPRTGDMQVAVTLYMLAIGAMAITAAVHRAPSLPIFAGAAIFVLSDSIIAIERFAGAFEGSRYAVMATYYTAQALLTYGIIQNHKN